MIPPFQDRPAVLGIALRKYNLVYKTSHLKSSGSKLKNEQTNKIFPAIKLPINKYWRTANYFIALDN